MEVSRRVHVVPIRYEFDRVVDPLREYGADRAYLLFHESDRGDRPTYRDDIVAHLDGELGIDVRVGTVDQYDVYDVFGLVTTLADEHASDDVYVNISAGSALAAVGASLGCMDVDTDATAYYVRPESWAHDGRTAPATTGVASVSELPTYPIDSPTRDQVVLMLLVAAREAGPSRPDKRTLIDDSLELATGVEAFEFGRGLIEDYLDGTQASRGRSFADLSTSEKKGAYRRLDRLLDPLEGRGYVETRKRGRQRHVVLTARGRNALRAFRHKATDAAERLEEREGLPDWLTARDRPETL